MDTNKTNELSEISHGLNNALCILKAYSAKLFSEVNESDKNYKALFRIKQSTEMAMTLALQLSKLAEKERHQLEDSSDSQGGQDDRL